MSEEDQKRRASLELANAYREMMGTFAWKHLKGVVMDRIRNDAMKAVDSEPIAQLTVAQVAEARGIRKAFDYVDTEIYWILNEHEAITRGSGRPTT